MHPGSRGVDDATADSAGQARPVAPTDERLEPGEVRLGKSEVLVGTGTTAVRLGEVKAFGSRQMPAADWAPRPSGGWR